ncbi:MAG: ABC transporter permease, partial [Candidatus Kuenenia stuttgartiensis]|nr:ABC transporter permease [Candidatus Kuenenia stuttgartiensis]
MNQIFFPFKIIGNSLHKFIRELGKMGCFFANALFYMLFPPYLFRRIIKQINFIGVKTVLVIVLTGTFTGMVLALQMYYVLIKFGAEARLGPAVA